jgi:hypothetical protein
MSVSPVGVGIGWPRLLNSWKTPRASTAVQKDVTILSRSGVPVDQNDAAGLDDPQASVRSPDCSSTA